MCSDRSPWRLQRASMPSNNVRASSLRPSVDSASMYQKVQTTKAFSGTPKAAAPRRAGRASKTRGAGGGLAYSQSQRDVDGAALLAAAQVFVGARREPRVEENVSCREDGRAVDVVLDLGVGLIADPHRTHAAVAGQRRDFALLDARLAADVVDRLQVAAVGARGDIDDVVEVALHRPRRLHPVQGAHHEVRVAQPT